ncbi:hypothetical protein Tco_0200711 [Tanacetum coccineum]
MKSVSMKQILARKKSLKTTWMQKESVSKQRRKPAKAEPTMHKDPAFDGLDDIVDDAMDYIGLGCARCGVVLVWPLRKIVTQNESNAVTTPLFSEMMRPLRGFGIYSPNKAKQKGVEIKMLKIQIDQGLHQQDQITLEALPKIDLRQRQENLAEVQEDLEAERKMTKKLVRKKLQRLLSTRFYDIRLESTSCRPSSASFRRKKEKFTVEESKFLYDSIHVGGKKHADLKNKNFEEIQVLYKKVKRSDKDFIAIGSAEGRERQTEDDTAKLLSGYPAQMGITWLSTEFNGHFRAFILLMERYELIFGGDLNDYDGILNRENGSGDFWIQSTRWGFLDEMCKACGVCILGGKDGDSHLHAC